MFLLFEIWTVLLPGKMSRLFANFTRRLSLFKSFILYFGETSEMFRMLNANWYKHVVISFSGSDASVRLVVLDNLGLFWVFNVNR